MTYGHGHEPWIITNRVLAFVVVSEGNKNNLYFLVHICVNGKEKMRKSVDVFNDAI